MTPCAIDHAKGRGGRTTAPPLNTPLRTRVNIRSTYVDPADRVADDARMTQLLEGLLSVVISFNGNHVTTVRRFPLDF
jgi:hypothetical protein